MSEDKVTDVKVLGTAKAADNPEVRAKDGDIVDMHRTAIKRTGLFQSDNGAGTYVSDPIAVEVTRVNDHGEETKIRGTLTIEAEMGASRSNLIGTTSAKQSFEPKSITFVDSKGTQLNVPVKKELEFQVGESALFLNGRPGAPSDTGHHAVDFLKETVKTMMNDRPKLKLKGEAEVQKPIKDGMAIPEGVKAGLSNLSHDPAATAQQEGRTATPAQGAAASVTSR
jgi:hypothetical protein